ncbi:sugar transferase [Methylophaga sp. 41_12_T18]|nr:sugar transferase [Methylophaga sp. 41_12_T18]
MVKKLAPIVLFVYNRPWHTQQTIEALAKNELAQDSELFIYSDAAKNELASQSVNEVRRYIKSINGFNKITIIERERNWGLASSIIDGVTTIINKYGKIIVLEDDLVTSPYFLNFMNDALEFYADKPKVWHVSGWNYPFPTDWLTNMFLWRLMNCWGWATWADRWQYYDKDIDGVISDFTKKETRAFNLDGVENFFGQVIANKKGKINTWAIFWYATIFKQSGLCVNPTRTYVHNIGFDASGSHCDTDDIYISNETESRFITFTDVLQEDKLAMDYLKLFYKNNKKTIVMRIISKLKRVWT